MAPDPVFVLVFAFGAGMVAFFSPCCVAMLPAYVSYVVRDVDQRRLGAAEPVVSARWRKELGAIAVWGGLLVAALGLGRLAIEALSAFGVSAPATSPSDREVAVGLAALGIAVTLGGFALSTEARRLRAGVAFGAVVTLGFLVVFVGLGLPVAFFARFLVSGFGLVAVLVGLGLIVLGAYTLLKGHLPIRVPSFTATRGGLPGYFLFGVAYGLASLSCTFPIFLIVVSLALVSGGGLAVAAFAAYALGKGSLMILVTVLSTSSRAAVEGRLRTILPRFDEITAAALVVSGAFIAFYYGVLYAPA
ncbi:MAG TPA: cytochrome c biogenesis protein CcdA [Candidatus Thermoplasmatota archaeon]